MNTLAARNEDKKRVICIGSLNMDMFIGIDRLPDAHEKVRCETYSMQCGGSAANTAYWLARLGCNVMMVGCVGSDYFGQRCVADLENVGANCRCIHTVESHLTGAAIIMYSGSSKRIITTGGANRSLLPDMLPLDQFDNKTHVHIATSNRAVALRALEKAKERGARTSADVGSTPCLVGLRLLDYCFINSDDLHRWLGNDDPIARWRELFHSMRVDMPPMLIVTRGAKGALCCSHDTCIEIPTVAVSPVDRTGGGDAFCAGVIARFVQKHDLVSCIKYGLELARSVILAVGSRPTTFPIPPGIYQDD